MLVYSVPLGHIGHWGETKDDHGNETSIFKSNTASRETFRSKVPEICTLGALSGVVFSQCPSLARSTRSTQPPETFARTQSGY